MVSLKGVAGVTRQDPRQVVAKAHKGCPRLSGRSERSTFDAVVVLVLEGSGLRSLDAEDLVTGDDRPAAVFEFDDHLLGEDFQSNHPALSAVGRDSRADGRQFALE